MCTQTQLHNTHKCRGIQRHWYTVERLLKNMTRKGRSLANESDRRRLLTLWPPYRCTDIYNVYTHTHTTCNITILLYDNNRMAFTRLYAYYVVLLLYAHIQSVYSVLNSVVNDEWGGKHCITSSRFHFHILFIH